MQNAVQLIRNEEFDKIRIVIIDNEVWFVAVDVCRALELKNARKAVASLDDDEKKIINLNTVTNSYGIRSKGNSNLNTVCKTYAIRSKGNPNVNVVNESGLYHLIFMSKKPQAKKLRRWVFHEVLPSIRKYGYYKVDNSQYQLAPDEVEKDGLLFFRPTKKLKGSDSFYEAYAKKTAEWEEKYPDGDYEIVSITPEYNKEGKLMFNYHIGFNPNPKKTNEY